MRRDCFFGGDTMNDTPISVFYRLSTLPIRTKFTLVSAVMVLAMLSLPYLSWYRDVSIRGMDNTHQAILTLDSKLLILQRTQNDFINLFDPKYRDEFSTTFETFVESTEDLKEQFWNLGLPIDTLEQLVVLTSEYQYLFEVMADTQTRIGHDNDHGLRKDVAEAHKKMETALLDVPANSAARLVLMRHSIMLQLPTLGLMIGHHERQLNSFELHYTNMATDVGTLVEGEAVRAKILSAMNVFRTTFHDLLKASQTVGLTYEDGLHGEISAIVSSTKKILSRLNTEVSAAIARRESNLNTLLGLMAAFFSISFIFIAIVLARSINAPIRGVTSIMTRLADGDLSVNIPDEPRTDEIGDMYRALRVFKMGAIIRRRTQEELRKAHDELEQRVEDRTRALSDEIQERRRTEQELMRAREQAEGANRAKSLFLANMSHELRTPLNAIIGFSEIMRDQLHGELPKTYLEYTTVINESGTNLMALINDILDMSKVESDAIELEETEFSLNTLLFECISLLSEKNRLGNVNVSGHIASNCRVHADRLRIKQILLNLLANAVKFSPGGDVIVASGRRFGRFAISITDTGRGMSTQEISNAVKPFGQTKSDAFRSHGESAGLGLPISKRLIEAHGGQLEIESALGEGTAVRVIFPNERVINDGEEADA